MKGKYSPESIKTQFEEIEKTVSSITGGAEKYSIAKAFSSGNHRLNRYSDVFPWDHSIFRFKDKQKYINASEMEFFVSFENRLRSIVTQGPLDSTVEDFWQMVIESDAPYIVMLCNNVEDGREKCAKYFCDHAGEEVSFDDFSVKTVSVNHLRRWGVVERTLLITVIDEDFEVVKEQTVTHYHYLDIADGSVPASIPCFVSFIEHCLAKRSPVWDNRARPVVHCSAGIGRAGTFVVLEALIALMKAGETVSGIEIKFTVVLARLSRDGVVQTSDQYKFLYDAVEYFQNFNEKK